MALFRSRSSEIPKDAIEITPSEALQMQWRLVSDWNNTSEIWSLKFTPSILGTLSATSGIYINNYFRKKLKLGNYGRFSSYLPIVVLPILFSSLAHKYYIQRIVLLQPFRECPLCVQLRAATFQVGCGIVHPMALAPMASLLFATRHYTYRLPSIIQDPKEVAKFIGKLIRLLAPTLGNMVIGHSLIAMFLTYMEFKHSIYMQQQIIKWEQQMEMQKTIGATFN